MIRRFHSKKPTFKDIEEFHEQNSPTNNEIELVETVIEVPTLAVSKPGKGEPRAKRWLS